MFTDAFRPVFTCVHALPPPRAISIKRGSSRADMTRELSPRSRASETMEKVHSPAGGGRSGPEAAGARRRRRLDVGVVRGGRRASGGRGRRWRGGAPGDADVCDAGARTTRKRSTRAHHSADAPALYCRFSPLLFYVTVLAMFEC